jgi:small subunit ribosomal protein S7
MSRRRRAEKREVLTDPKYGDVVVTKFMNYVMYEGKKAVAENIVYGAFDLIGTRRRDMEPLAGLPQRAGQRRARDRSPLPPGRRRRPIRFPVEVRPSVAGRWPIRWLINAARNRGENTMTEKLAGELLDASNNRGTGR